MITHVLNGDALATEFPFDGNLVICREALVDGPVATDKGLDVFWRNRARFIKDNFTAEGDHDYDAFVRSQFEKLKTPDQEAIHLWFEHDLFCQLNMWFTIFFLHRHKIDAPLYVVMPPSKGENIWLGFGRMDANSLRNCFEKKVQFSPDDKKLALTLWDSFQSHGLNKLLDHSRSQSACFPLLREVCEAHVARFAQTGLGRPQRILKSILDSGVKDFNSVFQTFWKTEGIYGFGDTQVRQMLAAIDPTYQ